jgi:hypothetical protein
VVDAAAAAAAARLLSHQWRPCCLMPPQHQPQAWRSDWVSLGW